MMALAAALSIQGCKSSKEVSERETRDSVVYVYKTLYRDSLRVKDSTVIVYETVQRDSVVLRVDKETGEVLSTDTWHWKDTNRDRDHVSEVRDKAEKIDSAALKSKGRVTVSKMENNAITPEKTHYTRTFAAGVAVGMLLALVFRYRKRVFFLFAKMW